MKIKRLTPEEERDSSTLYFYAPNKIFSKQSKKQWKHLQGTETTLYDTIMMDTCRSTFAQTHRTYSPTSEPHVNCGHVSGDAPAVPDAASGGDADGRGGCARVGAGALQEISTLAPRFCCQPKTALNK